MKFKSQLMFCSFLTFLSIHFMPTLSHKVMESNLYFYAFLGVVISHEENMKGFE